MSRRSALALLPFAAALLLAAAPRAVAGPRVRGHVATQGEQDCAACHRTATPAAFAAWEASPHGLALVKCNACHGSTGKDFRARPVAGAAACGGCHAAQAESVARRAVSDCFACHAPHTLSAHPHR